MQSLAKPALFLQAADVAGNNRTDTAEGWGVRYSIPGAGLSEDIDMKPQGLGLYSTTLLITSVGHGIGSIEIYLSDSQVRLQRLSLH